MNLEDGLWTLNLFFFFLLALICIVCVYTDFWQHHCTERVPLQAPSLAFCSYGFTSFQSDHHVVLCRLVKCTVTSVWFQWSDECNSLIWLQLRSSVKVCHSLLWCFCSKSTIKLCCYAPAYAVNLADPLQVFLAKYHLWHFYWLKLLRWRAAQNPIAPTLAVPHKDSTGVWDYDCVSTAVTEPWCCKVPTKLALTHPTYKPRGH